MDRFDAATRSRIMSRNRSTANRATEKRLRALMVQSGICGWRVGTRSPVFGHPDFIFPQQRLAIFVDGCFWHGCRRCRTIPATNLAFWASKIAKNRKRDREVGRRLRKDGWKVLRIWEHELRTNQARILEGIRRLKRAGRQRPPVSSSAR
jgi:DNA mismatch endonuclease (patch repair protein)